MQEIYPTNWPVVVDLGDPRNEFHERALHEARIATDVHEENASAPAPASQSSLIARLRLAIAGGPTVAATQPCDCPA
jgi:hypothetical protein